MNLLRQIADHLERYRTAKKAGLNDNQDLWADDPSLQKKMAEAHIDICDCCKDNKKEQEAEKSKTPEQVFEKAEKAYQTARDEMLKAQLKAEPARQKKMGIWREVTVQFPNKCLECKEPIHKGEKALWAQQVGIKHLNPFCKIASYAGGVNV